MWPPWRGYRGREARQGGRGFTTIGARRIATASSSIAEQIRRAAAAGRELSIVPDPGRRCVIVELIDRKSRRAIDYAISTIELDLPGADSLVGHHLRQLADQLDADPPEPARLTDAPFDRRWRVRARLPERFGQLCRVLARGKLNSALVEFTDGRRVVTSRNYLRRVPRV